MAKRPERTYKAGKVQVNVWVNKGDKFDSVSYQVSKNYKTAGENGEWKTTSSFTLQELADLVILIREIQRDYRVKLITNEDNDQSF